MLDVRDGTQYNLAIISPEDRSVLVEHPMTGYSLPRIGETLPVLPYEGPSVEEIEAELDQRRMRKFSESDYSGEGTFKQNLQAHIAFLNRWNGLYTVVDIEHEPITTHMYRNRMAKIPIAEPITGAIKLLRDKRSKERMLFESCLLVTKPRVLAQTILGA